VAHIVLGSFQDVSAGIFLDASQDLIVLVWELLEKELIPSR